MQPTKRAASVAVAVVVLAGAGAATYAVQATGDPIAPAPPQAKPHKHDDHGLHLGQTMAHHDADQDAREHHGLRLGERLAHTGLPVGHDHGLHLGQRQSIPGFEFPGLAHATHHAPDHRPDGDDHGDDTDD